MMKTNPSFFKRALRVLPAAIILAALFWIYLISNIEFETKRDTIIVFGGSIFNYFLNKNKYFYLFLYNLGAAMDFIGKSPTDYRPGGCSSGSIESHVG